MAQGLGCFGDKKKWAMRSAEWLALRQASEVLAVQSRVMSYFREEAKQRAPHMVVYRDGQAFHVPPDHIALTRKGDRVWIVPGTTL